MDWNLYWTIAGQAMLAICIFLPVASVMLSLSFWLIFVASGLKSDSPSRDTGIFRGAPRD